MDRKEKKLGPETASAHKRRLQENYYLKYCQGEGLDIGYKGASKDADPIENTIGVDIDYPGYNGVKLPFETESKDFVFSSHCLEHIEDYTTAIQEWFRVLKINGYLLITVPHMYLYEKKKSTPSRFNGDHKRFYTSGSLMIEIENSLEPNSYRVRSLKDCDNGFNYTIPPNKHSCGEYGIELVLQKIQKPSWDLE